MSNTLAIARLANMFSSSEFGKHYLERLRKIRKDLLKDAMDKTLTQNERADAAMRASSYDKEIEYFDIAKSIASNPDIVSRLTNSLKKKGFEDIL